MLNLRSYTTILWNVFKQCCLAYPKITKQYDFPIVLSKWTFQGVHHYFSLKYEWLSINEFTNFRVFSKLWFFHCMTNFNTKKSHTHKLFKLFAREVQLLQKSMDIDVPQTAISFLAEEFEKVKFIDSSLQHRNVLAHRYIIICAKEVGNS